LGIAAALITGWLSRRLTPENARDFYTAFMAATAFIYVGSALASQNVKTLVIESVVGVALFTLTLAGRRRSLKLTSLAFILHGVWDLLHARYAIGASAGQGFPVLCVAYDWAIAPFVWKLGFLDAKDRSVSRPSPNR
jgi:hypothetical protein